LLLCREDDFRREQGSRCAIAQFDALGAHRELVV
jgi:hypothetical protein